MLFKFKSNTMHPMVGALHLWFVPRRVTRGTLITHRHSFVPRRVTRGTLITHRHSFVPRRVTRGTLITHRHSFAPPRCRTSQHRRTFVPLSLSHRYDLSDPVFDGVRLAGFKSRISSFILSPIFLFFYSFHGLVVRGLGSSD